ncbi:MAG: hypothetical protein E7399_05625 [Ruminococcaceae bacterium]|nr:hypothetical protein [Oscillospiraceae bacterium]
MKLKDYLISCATGVLFLLSLWIFSDAAEGSTVSMAMMIAYLVILVVLAWRLTSWDAMKFSFISQMVAFIGYKIISLVNLLGDYRQDGFLADYEVGSYETMDLFFLLFLVTTFLMTALVRFALVRKKIRQTPKKTWKTIGIVLAIYVGLGIVTMPLWNVLNPVTAKLDQYCQTFSPEKWQNYAPKRELMLPDFLVEYKGISKAEAEELLGKPEKEEGYFVGYSAQGEMYAEFVFENDSLTDVNLISISLFGDSK